MTRLKWLEPSERDIENAVLYYLNSQLGVFAFKVNTTGTFDTTLGIYRRPSRFIIPGTPDVIACINGAFVGFEIKSKTGRQSEHQKAFQEKLESKARGYYYIIRSVKEAELAVETIKRQINLRLLYREKNIL